MRKVVLLILLAAVSGSAAAEWVGITANKAMDVYVDPATIRKAGNVVKLWDLFDLKTAQVSTDGRRYMSSKGQTEFDCKEERARELYVSLHSQEMGRGEIVSSAASNTTPWTPIVPGSLLEDMWKFACGKR